MASITFDGQSFMLDGRRIWLVSGSIHYARLPRDTWADRIHAAKLAGLNTIETPVVWSLHEPRPGTFNFTEGRDLRHFVQLVHAAGLYCILRPGPYIGHGYDNGGLPPWLLSIANIRLRTNSQPFLEASSRYITAVAQQVKDLQLTSPGEGGPIILLQNESGWTCGHDDLARTYLGELSRYYREAGLNVPLINANDLWQGIEGEIDCWTGSGNMLPHLRQLASIRPDQPRLVIDMRLGEAPVWGRPAPPPIDPDAALANLAQIIAAGAQFNLHPFAAGSNTAFLAGRSAEPAHAASHHTTAAYSGSLIAESGLPTPTYHAVRRLTTFASRFARVLAGLDPRRQPVTLHPDTVSPGASPTNAPAAPACVVTDAAGSQGNVSFIFTPPAIPSAKHRPRSVRLLLPDGTDLAVPLGRQHVVWCLFDVKLNSRATLDYCNLCAFARLDRALVCFGPAGADARISINDSFVQIEIPKANTPVVIEHEGITCVVVNEDAIDAVYLNDDAIYVGVSGLTRAGDPIPHPDYKSYTLISKAGQTSTHRVSPAKAAAAKPRTHAAITLSDWACAPASDYTSGQSPRFASINGPADLNQLGTAFGYGWYRLTLKPSKPHRAKVVAPHAADRLLTYLDSNFLGVIGSGPGAAHDLSISLKKSPNTLTILADNLGRPAGGTALGRLTGLFGHLHAVKPLPAQKPKLVDADPIDILAFQAPLWHTHRSDSTEAARLTWTLQHRKKTPIILSLSPLPARGLLVINDKPIAAFDQLGLPSLLLDEAVLSKGKNTIQLATLGSIDDHLAGVAHALRLEEALEPISAKAEWAFAKWEPPPADAYVKGTRKNATPPNTPAWWHAQFTPEHADSPLFLSPVGLTKGQLYINNINIGRYFMATHTHAAVGPQNWYVIPRSALIPNRPNDLLIFDEFGASPSRIRLTDQPPESMFA